LKEKSNPWDELGEKGHSKHFKETGERKHNEKITGYMKI
jgi:hypothetical protein